MVNMASVWFIICRMCLKVGTHINGFVFLCFEEYGNENIFAFLALYLTGMKILLAFASKF